MIFASINPATGQEIARYKLMSRSQTGLIVDLVHEGYLSWRKTGFAQRQRVLHKLSDLLLKRKPDYARLMTDEMGKPLAQGAGEIEKCALVCRYFADEGPGLLKPQMIRTEAAKSYAAFEPLGTVFAVMPWNFPFWQVFRFLAPMVISGNAGVLKHAANVTGCALAIEQLVKDAGAGKNIFRSVVCDNDTAAHIIRHPHVKAVTLTGSTRAGQSVAATAGSVLKKCVLELGGSDPYLILEDADLVKAVGACASSRLINSGQSCVAAKRFIVVKKWRKKFEELFVAQMKLRKMGDPLTEGTDIGPMARHDLRDQLHAQVKKSLRQGAKLLCGGVVPAGPGAYYPATVLTGVKKGMTAYEEELFGPVASIIPVANDKEAVKAANDSIYGLGAAVFSRNTKKAETIAREDIEAGCCFVNSFVRSDPRLPFGGIKESGYGRELSYFGLYEFVNIKTVYVA